MRQRHITHPLALGYGLCWERKQHPDSRTFSESPPHSTFRYRADFSSTGHGNGSNHSALKQKIGLWKPIAPAPSPRLPGYNKTVRRVTSRPTDFNRWLIKPCKWKKPSNQKNTQPSVSSQRWPRQSNVFVRDVNKTCPKLPILKHSNDVWFGPRTSPSITPSCLSVATLSHVDPQPPD